MSQIPPFYNGPGPQGLSELGELIYWILIVCTGLRLEISGLKSDGRPLWPFEECPSCGQHQAILLPADGETEAQSLAVAEPGQDGNCYLPGSLPRNLSSPDVSSTDCLGRCCQNMPQHHKAPRALGAEQSRWDPVLPSRNLGWQSAH